MLMKVDSQDHSRNQSDNSQNSGYDYQAMINALISLCDESELVICLDGNGVIKHIKETEGNTLLHNGANLIGKCMWDLIPSAQAEKRKHIFSQVLQSKKAIRFQDTREGRWFDSMVYPMRDKKGNVMQVLILGRDITAQKLAEDEIRRLNEQLEQRVAERTAELEEKTRSLEDLNTTLRVLLQKREQDKTELEEQVLSNIRHLILPNLEKVLDSLPARQQELLKVIHVNLNTITSPFNRRLSGEYLTLTPKEIQIANLIKDGKSSKEIAKFMDTSEKTVEVHRDHIRKKLGIKNKTANLRTYLLTGA